MMHAKVARWLSGPGLERRMAMLVLIVSLPSLLIGLEADDYILRQNVLQNGPLAAYEFTSRDPAVAAPGLLADRAAGLAPWWSDLTARTSFFRPLSSASLWLGFAHGLPLWWMHLENCVIFAITVWLAVTLYRRLGLAEAGLGWAALFFGLDAVLATSVGWLASRNTLLAACLGLASIVVYERARREARAPLIAVACALFALALASGELGLCALGYLVAHALTIDRAPSVQRAAALLPFGVVTAAYLAYYAAAGYGASEGTMYTGLSSPVALGLAWLESIPVWLATTTTLPIATFRLLVPGFRLPLLVFALVVSALLVPLLRPRVAREPSARMLALGAVLSVVPLASVVPQERLRFFVAFGVYGLLGPWVVEELQSTARARRVAARVVWGIHAILLPLLFVPQLFTPMALSAAGRTLDATLPEASAPTFIALNPPSWAVPWLTHAIRTARGADTPPVHSLYAGGEPIEIERVDERTLELHVARSWFVTPMEAHVRNVERLPFQVGDQVDLPPFDVEVRELDARRAPTRVRFTFDRPLEDPSLSFLVWEGGSVVRWTPPSVGGHVDVTPAGGL